MKLRYLLITGLLLLIATLYGCTDVERGAWSALGEKYTIRVYSGGKLIETFTSDGKVGCIAGVCDFVDASNGKFIRTTGDVIIQVQ